MLGHHELVKLLAEKGNSMMTNATNLTNGMGYSPLHLACAWNQLEVVRNLIINGADIQLKTLHGEKPIDIAKRYQFEQIVEYLEWIGKENRKKFEKKQTDFFFCK